MKILLVILGQGASGVCAHPPSPNSAVQQSLPGGSRQHTEHPDCVRTLQETSGSIDVMVILIRMCIKIRFITQPGRQETMLATNGSRIQENEVYQHFLS